MHTFNSPSMQIIAAVKVSLKGKGSWAGRE
jgi:hypothetical protein